MKTLLFNQMLAETLENDNLQKRRQLYHLVYGVAKTEPDEVLEPLFIKYSNANKLIPVEYSTGENNCHHR